MCDTFKELYQLNVNDFTDKKSGLKYLSWAYAIGEIGKKYDESFDYKIKKFGEKQLPYVYDEGVGFMVFTEVTIGNKTREMWLPVMDGASKAMLKEEYTYKTKYGDKVCEKATMFDVNKTIMRCLVKNLAMFGLGLYIYAGEDLPSEIVELASAEQVNRMRELGVNEASVCSRYKVGKLSDLSKTQADFVINAREGALKKVKGDGNE